jgi:hypothetical protein
MEEIIMIKKAEDFKLYLDNNKITAFQMEEVANDANSTVVFRTHVGVKGQQLPSALILDNSIFAVIRVQISPQALTAENELALAKVLNAENAKYKPFKLYFNNDGDLLLDVCMVARDGTVNAEEVLLMYNIIINYLDASYRNIMKAIW